MIMKSHQFNNNESLKIFSNIIANKIHDGFVIIERDDRFPLAILAKRGKKIDHAFNFIIFCVTIGLWSVVWVYLIFASKEKRILIAIDEEGIPFVNCYIKPVEYN